MFEKFAGNDKTKEIVKGMLKRDRLPHAILIEGDRGMGKTTFAKQLCKAILCGKNDGYCDDCRICTLFDAGTNPDFITVDASGRNSIKVEAVRELGNSVYIKPDRSKRKVYLIKDAETMSVQSQNSFLKILEEPPEYVVFVLLAVTSGALLETILSRCVHLKLKAPSLDEGIEVLSERFPDIPVSRLETELGYSDCNIGMAILQIEDKNISEIGVDADKILTMVARSRAYECLKTLNKYEWDIKGLSSLISHISSTAEINLRKLCLGEETGFALSVQQFIKITELCKKALKHLKLNVTPKIVITAFCSGLFN